MRAMISVIRERGSFFRISLAQSVRKIKSARRDPGFATRITNPFSTSVRTVRATGPRLIAWNRASSAVVREEGGASEKNLSAIH